MNYTVNPDESELARARSAVEAQVSRFEHSVEVEDAEFFLQFQRFERAVTHESFGGEILLTVNPDRDLEEEMEEAVLRGLLEVEYFERDETGERSLYWQDVKRMAYVKLRADEILGRDREGASLENWEEFREAIENDEPSKVYERTGRLADAVAESAESPEEILGMTRPDVIEAGENAGGSR